MHRLITTPSVRKEFENKIELPPPSPPDRGPKFKRVYTLSETPTRHPLTHSFPAKRPVEEKTKSKELTPEEVRKLRRSLSPLNVYKITNISIAQLLLFKQTPESKQKQQRNEFLAYRKGL